jgi:hypothetical protein
MVIDDHPSAPQASKTSHWEQQIRRVVQVDDLRPSAELHEKPKRQLRGGNRSQEKGHQAQLAHLASVLSDGAPASEPDPLDSMATLAPPAAAQTSE